MRKKEPLGKSFSERVVEIALSIPKGKVTTYGRIARAAGAGPMASQSITGILAKAYDEGQTSIPFHRIVYADGSIWVSEEYRAKRMKLYKQEGIEIDKNDKIKNFKDILLEFK
jgi:methylated-DNA-protein-cysteine methyltransferase related protein